MGVHPEEIALKGGNVTAVVRVGDIVRRTMRPWSPTVHGLLRHLEALGFEGAPRVLGVDERGREILSFMPGEVPQFPLPGYALSEQTLTVVARLLRRYHDATLSYSVPAGAHWQQQLPGPPEVICHTDVAPYNTVFVDGMPSAFIDFDGAAPGPRIWDVAYATYRFTRLDGMSSEVASATAPDFTVIGAHLRHFCVSYGLEDSGLLVDMIIQRVAQMCDWLSLHSAAGDAAIQKMVAEGHLAHYERELAFLRRHQGALQRSLTPH